MFDPIGGSSSSALEPRASAPSGAGETSLATQQTFLTLLVAQLQHQDPLSPSDPMQFVAQLAQFSQLEQSIGMNGHLAAIEQALARGAQAPADRPVSA